MKKHQLKFMALAAIAIFTLTTYRCYGGETSWDKFANDRYSTEKNEYRWVDRTLNGLYTMKGEWVEGKDGGHIFRKNSKANFSNCTLINGGIASNCHTASFERAKLHGVRFFPKFQDNGSYTLYCHIVDFTNAELCPYTPGENSPSALTNAVGISFTGSIFDGAKLNGGNFTNSHFWGTSMVGTDCSSVPGIIKVEGKLEEATFRTNFSGATFEDMTMSGADFTDAKLKAVKMNNVTMNKLAISQDEPIKTDFSGADFSQIDLGGDNNITIIKSSKMYGVNFQGAKFNHACIEEGTEFYLCTFDGADFTEATLKDLEIVGGQFDHTIFKKTKMTNVDLSSLTLFEPDFTDAEFDDVDFNHTSVIRGNFTGAKILTQITWTDGDEYTNDNKPKDWEV